MLTADNAPPFHDGEREIQERLEVDDKMAHIGAVVLRDHMPQQHRDFFEQLPFLVIGALDQERQPWASILAADAGFISTPDETTMRIQASPMAGDPLGASLQAGASIGLLGIEPHTRRRNRMNGVISETAAGNITIKVQQSFGNCPKYIQARKATFVETRAANMEIAEFYATALDARSTALIESADTFFIASAHPDAGAQSPRAHGVDVSHRGGNPGFVKVIDANTLLAPDYIGNFFFNTLGNLRLNPRAGLLFVDVEKGDLLYIAVTAEVEWDGPAVNSVAGAERLLRFAISQIKYLPAALPLRWGAAEISPYLERMA